MQAFERQGGLMKDAIELYYRHCMIQPIIAIRNKDLSASAA